MNKYSYITSKASITSRGARGPWGGGGDDGVPPTLGGGGDCWNGIWIGSVLQLICFVLTHSLKIHATIFLIK